MILECAASLPGAAQPDETALSLQAGNRERFHVKHGHRGRQSGDFVVRPAALHGQPHPALGQRAVRPGGEIGQRGKGARRHHIERARDGLDPPVPPVQVGQPQRARHLLHEGGLLAHGIDTGDVDVGAADGNHHPRQAAAAAHVEQAQRPPAGMRPQRRDQRQAVQHVMGQHVGGVAHRRQVVDPVPLEQQIEVGQQALDLPLVQRQAKRLRAGAERRTLRVHQAASAAPPPAKPLKPPFFRWISSSEMAAGVTPLMRLA